MEKSIDPVPAGHHTLQPVINVSKIDSVITFVQKVFGAVEIDRYDMPDGSTAHIEVKIGDSILTLGPPDPSGPFPAKIFVYVPDVDQTYQIALAKGGESLMEPTQQFYGQRVARVKDEQGNLWVIASQTELVSRQEAQRRFAALFES